MTPGARPLTTPLDILEAALAREHDAHAFYKEALKHAGNEDVRQLLEQLMDAEYKHVRLVEKELVRLRNG